MKLPLLPKMCQDKSLQLLEVPDGNLLQISHWMKEVVAPELSEHVYTCKGMRYFDQQLLTEEYIDSEYYLNENSDNEGCVSLHSKRGTIQLISQGESYQKVDAQVEYRASITIMKSNDFFHLLLLDIIIQSTSGRFFELSSLFCSSKML